MAKSIHPKLHPVVFVDTTCQAEFVTISTLTSPETREINGVPHYVLPTEISSASHPFYTGKQVLIDTARRVEKFRDRTTRQASTAAIRKGKQVKRLAKAKKTAEKKIIKKKKETPVVTETQKNVQ